jgi:hypothetical protein
VPFTVGEIRGGRVTAYPDAEMNRGDKAQWRVTMRLARLLAKQGRRDEARTILTEIYNWFTEDFDSSDLKDAKALLGELQAS